jgi:PleD family two-component response regulator
MILYTNFALLFLGAAGGGRMSKRILVVEDQADNRQVIRDMLATSDYEITEVES